jgi:hypothetical protein
MEVFPRLLVEFKNGRELIVPEAMTSAAQVSDARAAIPQVRVYEKLYAMQRKETCGRL